MKQKQTNYPLKFLFSVSGWWPLCSSSTDLETSLSLLSLPPDGWPREQTCQVGCTMICRRKHQDHKHTLSKVQASELHATKSCPCEPRAWGLSVAEGDFCMCKSHLFCRGITIHLSWRNPVLHTQCFHWLGMDLVKGLGSTFISVFGSGEQRQDQCLIKQWWLTTNRAAHRSHCWGLKLKTNETNCSP